MTKQEMIATVLVNQKIMRNGSPPVINALELLPPHLYQDVMEDAQAVVDALEALPASEEAK